MTWLLFTLFFLSPFLIVICAFWLAVEHFGGFAQIRAEINLSIARWQIRAAQKRTMKQMRQLERQAEGWWG
jgi:hypothetical protein